MAVHYIRKLAHFTHPKSWIGLYSNACRQQGGSARATLCKVVIGRQARPADVGDACILEFDYYIASDCNTGGRDLVKWASEHALNAYTPKWDELQGCKI